MTLYELCRRDVIHVVTGANLGRVDDLAFEESTARVTNLILYGRLKWFGLLGREEDTYIPWADVQIVGPDAVLVHTDVTPPKRGKRRWLPF